MDNPIRRTALRLVRDVGVWALAAALAVAMTWPLTAGLTYLGRTQNSDDARFSAWNVAWVAHALATNPAHLFDANIFYPHRDTLAFSETNLVAGIVALPVWVFTHNPFTSLNIVVLFSFASDAMRERGVRYIAVHYNRYNRRSATDVAEQLETFKEYLRPVAQAEGVELYEVRFPQ